ncbi:MAG: hypothetical protein J7M15_02685, partial [Anaerolineae bacterium]|nr:hypothetical protein [Anaerolineae bacterium]
MTDLRQGVAAFGGELSTRERFNRYMHFQQVDYIPSYEFGYWDELKENWMAQGHLPASLRRPDGHIPDRAVEEHFGIEQFEHIGVPLGAFPQRERKIVSRGGGKIVYRDGLGVLVEERTEGTRTIPHFLEFPVKDRSTWESFRDEFLDAAHPARAVSDDAWRHMLNRSRGADQPVVVWFGSFTGWVRDWIGFENLAYLSVDDPGLVEEMVAHLADMLLTLLPPVLERCQIDAAAGWEDIAFNSGPLLSPRFFRERIMPHMRPVMQMLRQHGIDVIWTDCDGNINELVPLWLSVGLNCMFPLEVNAGNDPVALRAKYGRDLLIMGGFDKFALHEGREAILDELKRLEPVVADGGYIPHVDHRCPAGVSWDNYCYY